MIISFLFFNVFISEPEKGAEIALSHSRVPEKTRSAEITRACLDDLHEYGLDPHKPFRSFRDDEEEEVRRLLSDRDNLKSKYRLGLSFMSLVINRLQRRVPIDDPDFDSLRNLVFMKAIVRGIELFDQSKRIRTSQEPLLRNLVSYLAMRVHHLAAQVVLDEYWHRRRETSESDFGSDDEDQQGLFDRTVGSDGDDIVDAVDGRSLEVRQQKVFERMDLLIDLFFKNENRLVAVMNGRHRTNGVKRIELWKVIVNRWKTGISQRDLAAIYRCTRQNIARSEARLKADLLRFMEMHPDMESLKPELVDLGFGSSVGCNNQESVSSTVKKDATGKTQAGF